MQVNSTVAYLFIYFIISTVCSIYKDNFFPGTGLAKFQGTGQPNSFSAQRISELCDEWL